MAREQTLGSGPRIGVLGRGQRCYNLVAFVDGNTHQVQSFLNGPSGILHELFDICGAQLVANNL